MKKLNSKRYCVTIEIYFADCHRGPFDKGLQDCGEKTAKNTAKNIDVIIVIITTLSKYRNENRSGLPVVRTLSPDLCKASLVSSATQLEIFAEQLEIQPLSTIRL